MAENTSETVINYGGEPAYQIIFAGESGKALASDLNALLLAVSINPDTTHQRYSLSSIARIQKLARILYGGS